MINQRNDALHSSHENEHQILSNVVDAILAVENELVDATMPVWRNVVINSCRIQKLALTSRLFPIETVC